MIKLDIIKQVAAAGELTQQHAEIAVNIVFEALREALVHGERIELRGLGVFLVKSRKHGIGRNPKTGVVMPIPPGRVVRFKPGKALADLPPDPPRR